jgi:undecaprenyl-diphosphatase
MSGVHATLSLWEACLLGVVQGLTEFLPVSSDGHLAVLQHFLTPMPAEQKLAVDVALHLGTLVALLVYYRDELVGMAAAMLGRRGGYARTWIGLIILGTLPAAVAGLTLRDRIAATLDSLPAIGVFFLVTGTLLFLASAVTHPDRDEEALGVRDALLIGSFQATALLPGISRSGTTIAAGLFRRARADVAAKFSFLLGVPAIAGAIVVEGRSILALDPGARVPLAVGVVAAALTGFLAIALCLRLVRAARLHWFAYYCWAIGAAVLAFGGSA